MDSPKRRLEEIIADALGRRHRAPDDRPAQAVEPHPEQRAVLLFATPLRSLPVKRTDLNTCFLGAPT
jgi:hypothetical protein